MRRKLRREYQEQFNKKLKALNDNIANDDLWRGRFEFRQNGGDFEYFSDGSGGILHVNVRGYDKKTGYYKDFHLDFAPYYTSNDWHIWEMGNKFITEDTGVWDENPRPGKNNGFAVDYTNIAIPAEVWKQPFNYFVTFKYWKEDN